MIIQLSLEIHLKTYSTLTFSYGLVKNNYSSYTPYKVWWCHASFPIKNKFSVNKGAHPFFIQYNNQSRNFNGSSR